MESGLDEEEERRREEHERHRGESQNRGIQINDRSDETMAATLELLTGYFDKKFIPLKRKLSEDNEAKTQSTVLLNVSRKMVISNLNIKVTRSNTCLILTLLIE